MDTDSLPSALTLVISLTLFSYMSVVERSSANGGSHTRSTREWRRGRLILKFLKYISIIAATLSAFTLLRNNDVSAWGPALITASLLLLLFFCVDQLLGSLASKKSSVAVRISRPMLRLLGAPGERSVVNHVNGGTPAYPSENGANGSNPEELSTEMEDLTFTEEELEALDQRDREMLRSILQLDISTAHEIMVPRLDVVAVPVNASLIEAVELFSQTGHNRLPVFEETIDRIVGIIHSRDALATLAQEQRDTPLVDLLRPAYFIPETKRLDHLLVEMQEKGIQMAIVVDEYGGTEGIVTMEDILEEIVGEIEDEFSLTRESQIIPLQDGGVMVEAGIPTEDIDEMFGTRLDHPDVDTIGGYVYQSLGRIPQVGDVVFGDHLKIEVVSILGRRLRKLRINRINGNSTVAQVVTSATASEN